MKLPKPNDYQWASIGCPEKHPDIGIFHVQEDSKLGVRCCTRESGQCYSETCNFQTFEEAEEVCANKGSGEFRLCSSEELNKCCNDGCSGKFDGQKVWIEATSKGSVKTLDLDVY